MAFGLKLRTLTPAELAAIELRKNKSPKTGAKVDEYADYRDALTPLHADGTLVVGYTFGIDLAETDDAATIRRRLRHVLNDSFGLDVTFDRVVKTTDEDGNEVSSLPVTIVTYDADKVKAERAETAAKAKDRREKIARGEIVPRKRGSKSADTTPATPPAPTPVASGKRAAE